ncbi:MAG: oligopeptide:H+ symporter [Planctomycetota bacterium]
MTQAAAATPEKTLLGHPRGLFVLFFAELWERFSYYGMRALLTLYMIKVLGMTDGQGAGVYGGYTGLVYLFPVLGGWLADKVLGYRKAIILGGLLMAIGHGLMAIQDNQAFYMALAFLCVGNGFFKPNISSTVGKLYAEGDQRRDAGFTIFYMGINVGAMLAPLVCGYLGEDIGWHYGFSAAAIGMLLGLTIFMIGTKELHGKGEPRDPSVGRRRVLGVLPLEKAIWLGSFVCTPLIALLLLANRDLPVAKQIVNIIGLFVLFVLIRTGLQHGRVALHRIISLIILMVFHAMFWTFFEQAGSSLTLFADRVVDRVVPIYGTATASQFQAMNPFFIIVFAPIFTMIWTKLGARQPSIPVKFALGLLQLGLGFGVLVLGMNAVSEGEKVGWIILGSMYLLHTTGELCLSPVGLSAVTKLAPPTATAFVMGAWFLSIAFGNITAGELAAKTEVSFEATAPAEIAKLGSDEAKKEKQEENVLHELSDKHFVYGTGLMKSVTVAGLDGYDEPGRSVVGFVRLQSYRQNGNARALLSDEQRGLILNSISRTSKAKADEDFSKMSREQLEARALEKGLVLDEPEAKRSSDRKLLRLLEGGEAGMVDVLDALWTFVKSPIECTECAIKGEQKSDDGDKERTETVNLLQLVGDMGELGIEPGRLLDHLAAKEMLDTETARRVREIIGADGLTLQSNAVEGLAKEDLIKERKAWVKEFAKAMDLKPETRDEVLDGLDPGTVTGAHVATENLANHMVGPVLEKYRPVYFWVFIVAVGSAVLLFVLSPLIKKLMHGVN